MVEFEIFVIAYIMEGSVVMYQIGYVPNRCPRSTISNSYIGIKQIKFKVQEFEIFLGEKRSFRLCRDSSPGIPIWIWFAL